MTTGNNDSSDGLQNDKPSKIPLRATHPLAKYMSVLPYSEAQTLLKKLGLDRTYSGLNLITEHLSEAVFRKNLLQIHPTVYAVLQQITNTGTGSSNHSVLIYGLLNLQLEEPPTPLRRILVLGIATDSSDRQVPFIMKVDDELLDLMEFLV